MTDKNALESIEKLTSGEFETVVVRPCAAITVPHLRFPDGHTVALTPGVVINDPNAAAATLRKWLRSWAGAER